MGFNSGFKGLNFTSGGKNTQYRQGRYTFISNQLMILFLSICLQQLLYSVSIKCNAVGGLNTGHGTW